MRQCPYCGVFNADQATDCQQCRASLPVIKVGQAKRFLCGPEKAREVRRKAMAAVALGLLMWVYWGGHGPWMVVDNPTLGQLRTYIEPLLIYGGAALYALGWILSWV